MLPSRRRILTAGLACVGSFSVGTTAMAASPSFRLATFSADVTPPLGHPCMAGGIAPIQIIDDPLFAHGFVLLGAEQPLVLTALDWCEIRNDAHDRWRTVLAEAAQTIPARVLVTCIHQHDAPVADLEAERILRQANARASICDPDFHERAVQRVARAVRAAIRKPRQVSHLGMGQAKVEQVASNRRYFGTDGKVQFGRTSATRDPWARRQPEGTVDPWLKTLSFWDGRRPLKAQQLRPDSFVMTMGYGECAPGYIPIERAWSENDSNLHDWCWIAPGAERAMTQALAMALKK